MYIILSGILSRPSRIEVSVRYSIFVVKSHLRSTNDMIPYGMILCMFNLSEIPGCNSIVTVPFTCVCNMVYGPVVLIPSFWGFHVSLSILCLS